MSKKGIKLQLPSAVDDPTGLRKLEHYCGIQFLRDTSNSGGADGYHSMIGDETLLAELAFHNMIKIAKVKDGVVQCYLNQLDWTKDENGNDVDISGADGSDFYQVRTKDLYAIIGGSDPTYERFIISDKPFSYEGDEAVLYPAGGESPDYITVQGNKSRSVYNPAFIGSQGVTDSVLSAFHLMDAAGNTVTGDQYGKLGFGNGAGMPTTQRNIFQFEAAARALNADAGSNKPYCNSNNIEYELLIALMYIEFRSKILVNYLGHGISSNVAPSAANWGQVSGVRYSSDNGATWAYSTFGAANFKTSAGVASNFWNILNGNFPVLTMFEAQLAVSKGATLEPVHNSDGQAIQGVSSGVMTGIFTKRFGCIYTVDNTTYKVEAVMRVPVWRGRTRLWGNIWTMMSGYSMIDYTVSGELHRKLFRAPSIKALTTDADATVHTQEGLFPFENSYNKIAETADLVAGWCTDTIQDAKAGVSTGIGSAKHAGGGILNYQSAYLYLNPTPPAEGQYVRRIALVGGRVLNDFAVLRYVVLNNDATYSSANVGSGSHVELSA